jgi:hypothetical protein
MRPLNELAHFRHTLNKIFNGDGLVATYLRNVCTTKETTMMVIASDDSAFATNNDEWISYSHWGMFPVRRKTSNSRGEA